MNIQQRLDDAAKKYRNDENPFVKSFFLQSVPEIHKCLCHGTHGQWFDTVTSMIESAARSLAEHDNTSSQRDTQAIDGMTKIRDVLQNEVLREGTL